MRPLDQQEISRILGSTFRPIGCPAFGRPSGSLAMVRQMLAANRTEEPIVKLTITAIGKDGKAIPPRTKKTSP